MTIGERLREERTRLKLSQPAFGELAGTTKQTVFSWESGKTSPDGFQLGSLASRGVDVLYVLTGHRGPSSGTEVVTDQERKLLNGFRLCSQEAQRHLIQTAALLAAGIAPGPSEQSKPRAVRKDPSSVQVGNLTSSHGGAVQVGYAGGKVSVKKSSK